MPDKRVTLREASMLLGVSEGAIRKRVARGTIRSEMGDDGLRYVWVDAGTDAGADASSTRESDAIRSGQSELVEALRDQVADLRARLDREQDANRENRRIIAALTSRIPELEPASEQRQAPVQSPEPAEASKEAAQQPPEAGVGVRVGQVGTEPYRGSERASWWRRFFGFE